MKTLFKSLKITLAFCVFFSVFYILILWIFAQVAGPNKGNAEVATLDGKVVGAANVGQMFTKDIYFWGRPSHAGDGYDASSSAGSNKGPSNEEHLALLEERIDTFLVHHPYLTREKVPAEIITASSSVCLPIPAHGFLPPLSRQVGEPPPYLPMDETSSPPQESRPACKENGPSQPLSAFSQLPAFLL